MTDTKYLLEAIGDNRWLCVDQLTGVSVEWVDKKFNETQDFKLKDMPTDVSSEDLPTALARLANEMGQWLADNHRAKIEQLDDDACKQWYREFVGRQVREIRLTCGMSLADFGEFCGLAKSHIYRIERGEYNVSIDTLAKILDATGANITL